MHIGMRISLARHWVGQKLNSKSFRNTEKLLAHPLGAYVPHIELHSAPAKENPDRIVAAERLLTAYHKAVADEAKSPLKKVEEDMWTGILRKELPELMAAIESRNAERLANFLMNFGSSYVWFGGVTTSTDGYTHRSRDPYQVALVYWGNLIRLAEYLGVLPVENPSSGQWDENLFADPVKVVAAIEEKIGISVFVPHGAIHTDGLNLSTEQSADRGLLHYRHINALYAALRLSVLADENRRNNVADGAMDGGTAVCEYGGGLGMTALYAQRLGLSDYTILDLPITCLLSGHYLLLTCGLDSVSLYGEEERADQIKIRPYYLCTELPDLRFSITLNQDGLNEIGENLRNIYRNEIRRTTQRFFLSFNHEVFFPKTVAHLMKDDSAFHNIHRSPYWPREGYVEELFSIHHDG